MRPCFKSRSKRIQCFADTSHHRELESADNANICPHSAPHWRLLGEPPVHEIISSDLIGSAFIVWVHVSIRRWLPWILWTSTWINLDVFMVVRYIGQFKFKRPIRTRIHVFSIRTGDVFCEHKTSCTARLCHTRRCVIEVFYIQSTWWSSTETWYCFTYILDGGASLTAYLSRTKYTPRW